MKMGIAASDFADKSLKYSCFGDNADKKSGRRSYVVDILVGGCYNMNSVRELY